MNQYKRYKCADFATDTDFIRWVQHPDSVSDTFWLAFIQLYPDLENEIFNARAIVQSLTSESVELQENDARKLWEKIDADICKQSRKKIERHYAIWFIIDQPAEKSINKSSITGKLDLKEDVEEVLKTIENLVSISHSKTNNQQILIFKK